MLLTSERNWAAVSKGELTGNQRSGSTELAENAVFSVERYTGLLPRTAYRVSVRSNSGGSAFKFAEADEATHLLGVWQWCETQFEQLRVDVAEAKGKDLPIDWAQIDKSGWHRKAVLAIAKERVAAHFDSLRTAESLLKKRAASAAPSSSQLSTMPVFSSSRASSSSDAATARARSDATGKAEVSAASSDMHSIDSAEEGEETQTASEGLLRNARTKRKLLKASLNTETSNATTASANEERSPKVAAKGRRKKDSKAGHATAVLDAFRAPFPSREQRTIKLAVSLCALFTVIMALSRLVSFDFFVLLWLLIMYLCVEIARRRREIILKLYKRKVARTRREIASRLKSWLKGGKRRKSSPAVTHSQGDRDDDDDDDGDDDDDDGGDGDDENGDDLDDVSEGELAHSLVADDDADGENDGEHRKKK
jgi:hypothetical protein